MPGPGPMAEFDGDTPAVAYSTQNRLACDIKILGPLFVNRDHDNIVALLVEQKEDRMSSYRRLSVEFYCNIGRKPQVTVLYMTSDNP